VDRALGLFGELLPSQGPPVVLHGDLHHFNILRAGDGWRAIDPKGLVGDPAYDCAALLFNPWDSLPRGPQLPRTLARRIAILADTLGLDRERIHGWALAQSVLSAWWSYDDGAVSPEVGRTLLIAEALATLRP
jgi:streptomycin 6-kinase